jgi:hypothetical protein
MALQWQTNYQSMIGRVGTALFVPGSSDYYAEFGNRLYLISADGGDPGAWYLTVLANGQLAGGDEFDSLEGAKAGAEDSEAKARFAEGFHYAHLKGAPVARRAAFGRRWRDEYADRGLSGEHAWAKFNAE